jgi:transcriptional regulator with XRE-family HTH domain
MSKEKNASLHVPYSKELGQFLKEGRVKAKLSQWECASKLGYETSQVISNWERGVQSPPFNKLIDICRLFNFSPTAMMEKLLDVQRELYKESLLSGQGSKSRKLVSQKRKAS